MDDTQQPEQRRFSVKLIQRVEVTSEVLEFAADNKKDALTQAQNFIDDEKDLEGQEYRLEAEEIVQSEPDPAPHGADEATDTSTEDTAQL